MNRSANQEKLVSNARAIIANETSIPMGCTRMGKILTWLGDEYLDRYPVFSEYQSDVRTLPTTSERLHWSLAALLEKDAELAVITERYREKILEACFDIVSSLNEKDYA